MNLELNRATLTPEVESALEQRIWLSVSTGERQIPGIQTDNEKVIRGIISRAVSQMIALEKAVTNPGKRLERLHTDIDVVMMLSGAGTYSGTINTRTEKPVDTQYHHIEWMGKLDRARIRAGILAMLGVVANRAQKDINQVTNEDVAEFGPCLHYAATVWENQHFEKVIAHFEQLGLHIPPDKLITYSFVQDERGEREMKNTYDQFVGLQIPEDTRRLLIVAHIPHLLRGMHVLKQHSDNMHQAQVQLYPLKSPAAGLADYIVMETRGIVANYLSGKGSAESYPFEV